MNYPLISEYIEAIKAPEDNFEELTNLRPVLGDDGQPVMTSGNFAVVFKMEDVETGKFYALKCFTKEQEGRGEAYHQIADALTDVDSPYLVSIRYLDKELFVDTEQTAETEFPVLLMDWVDGKTLDKYLRENLDDKYVLEMLAYRFSQLAQWLIPQPFAHGDLKPDNILVREDGALVLVDYDGMFVPPMKGQKSRELGSPDFRHPQRTEDDFDEHIDDFSLISILLSLKAISINSQWYVEYCVADRLLFSKKDYNAIYHSRFINDNFPSEYLELNRLVSIFVLSISEKKISVPVSFYSITGPKSIIEDKGFIYSSDKKWLVSYNNKDGFADFCVISPSVTHIENGAFSGCRSIQLINIPITVKSIGNATFENCVNLINLVIPKFTSYIGKSAFRGCIRLRKAYVSGLIKCIDDKAFAGCESLELIKLSDSIEYIGTDVFDGCNSLSQIVIPSGSREKFKHMLPKLNVILFEDINF